MHVLPGPQQESLTKALLPVLPALWSVPTKQPKFLYTPTVISLFKSFILYHVYYEM